MNHMSHTCLAKCLPALCGFLLMAAPALAQRDDLIYPAKGAPARGNIQIDNMKQNKVLLDVTGGSREFPVNEISRITFKDDPPELVSGRNNVLQRNYNQALTELKKLDGQKIDRAYVRQDIEFFKALCQCRLAMSEGGDKNAALTAMLNFVKAAPQNYHFFEAAEVLGDLSMSAGKWAEAAKYYGPIAATEWPDYQMRANNAIGRALVGEIGRAHV